MLNLPRFNQFARNLNEVLFYYHNRATQLLSTGWSWNGEFQDLDYGIQVQLYKANVAYDSIYILKKGQGYLTRWFDEQPRNFVTMQGCTSMYDWVSKKEKKYTLATPYDSDAYREIAIFYREQRAKRSKVFYMNHIDEGLYILQKINASKIVCDAYCLHPLYQNQNDFANNWNKLKILNQDYINAVVLALEYRNIANAYLPSKIICSLEQINLSIPEVNQMLIADKIQNRKDFELYNSNHSNAERLKRYFQDWFYVLNISESFYLETVEEIKIKTGNLNGLFNNCETL